MTEAERLAFFAGANSAKAGRPCPFSQMNLRAAWEAGRLDTLNNADQETDTCLRNAS